MVRNYCPNCNESRAYQQLEKAEINTNGRKKRIIGAAIMENSRGSIYMQLLGEDFGRLSPQLQRVHGLESNLQANGRVTVTHGRSRLVRLLNRLMRVPPAGTDVPLRLHIERSATQETWVRDFGGKPLVTRQWAEQGLFVEAVGRIHMHMRLILRGERLCFEPVRTTCLGIAVPKWLRVNVRAEVQPHAEGWQILVETNSSTLGLMFRYEGLITLAP